MKGRLFTASLRLAVCSSGWWLVGWCNTKWPSAVGYGSSASTKELQLCNLQPLLGTRLTTCMKASCSCLFLSSPKKDTGKEEIIENRSASLVWLTSSLSETRAIKQSNPKVFRYAGENLRNISAKTSKIFKNTVQSIQPPGINLLSEQWYKQITL